MLESRFTFTQREPLKIVEITETGALYFQGELVENLDEIIEVLVFILQNWKR